MLGDHFKHQKSPIKRKKKKGKNVTPIIQQEEGLLIV